MAFMAPLLAMVGMGGSSAAAAGAVGAGVGAAGTAMGIGLGAELVGGTAVAGGTAAATAAGAGITAGQALMAGGSLISGVSQILQGNAQANALEANADAARYNMQQEEEASAARFDEIMGQQRVLFASAGVDITSGSPLLIEAHTAYKKKKEQERIKYAGGMEISSNKYAAGQARTGGMIGGASTFLTGLGRAAYLD